MGVEDHDRARRYGQQDPLAQISSMGLGHDSHRRLVLIHGFGEVPGADLPVAPVGCGRQERVVAIVDVQAPLLGPGVGVARPVVGVAEEDVLGFEHPPDELDEVPVDDEFIEEHVGVGEVVPQDPICGRIAGERLPGREGPAEALGDPGPAFLRIEILYDHKALFYKSLEMIICQLHAHSSAFPFLKIDAFPPDRESLP